MTIRLGRILQRTLAVVVFFGLAIFLIRDASCTVMAWEVFSLPVRGLLLFGSDFACLATAACATAAWPLGARWSAPTRALGCAPAQLKQGIVVLSILALCLCIPLTVFGMIACEPETLAYCKLMNAIKGQDLAAVNAQLAQGADPNDYNEEDDFEAPLNAAVSTGDLAVVGALLDGGANIERADILKGTPLATAAESGKPEMILMLIRRGAKVNDTLGGSSALEAARRAGHSDCAHLLRTYGAK